MKIRSLVKEKEFIPEFDGNRDLKKEDQIIVNIKKFPNNEEIGKIKNHKFDTDGNVMINYGVSYVLKNCVGSIKGIELDEGREPVTNGSSLASSDVLELEPIISEIVQYLLKTSEVLEEKES